MFSYKTPDSLTPPEFKKNAREQVLNNLTVTSRIERPHVLGSSPILPSDSSLLSSNSSISLGFRDDNNNNNNNNSNSFLHYNFNKTSPTLDSRRSSTIEPSNDAKRIKTSPGFLSRLKNTKKEKSIVHDEHHHNSTTQNAYTHTTNSDNNNTLHSTSSINNSPYVFLPPLSRTSSRSSISTGSIFSTNSNYSGSSSISEFSTMNHNTHSPKESRDRGLSYSYSYSQNVKHVGLVQILDEINSPMNHNVSIGKKIFDELNTIVNSSNVQGINASNHPDKLIDWNLNLMRLLMFINDPNINEIPEEIRVDLDDRNARILLTSELIKAFNSNSNTQEFKDYFLVSVMSPSVFGKCQETNGNFKLDLKIEKVKTNLNDESFCELLIDSELFKEFNIDSSFKRLLAKVSIEKARGLQDLKYSRSSNQYLLDEFKVLALRNYFLNLLVASQTLFEYHYSLSSIINRPNNHTSGPGLVSHINQFNDSDKKWLWDNIRERNFNKIKIFDI